MKQSWRGRDFAAAAFLVMLLRDFKQRAKEEGQDDQVAHIDQMIYDISAAFSEAELQDRPRPPGA